MVHCIVKRFDFFCLFVFCFVCLFVCVETHCSKCKKFASAVDGDAPPPSAVDGDVCA